MITITKIYRNSENTIQKLINAAYIVFTNKGYERATVEDIASAAGYTKGAFYWHFSSKEDLFLRLIDYRVKSQQEFFLNKLNLNKNLSYNIQAIFEEMVELTKKDNWTPIFIEFLAQAARKENVKKQMANMYRNWRSFMFEVLEQAKKADLISNNIDSNIAAALFIALFDGFNLQTLVDNGSMSIKDTAAAIHRIIS